MKPSLPAGFTLVELMAATAVLASVLLLMLGMQDQMSRAWSNANRRTETGREARAALRMMATDLAALRTRTTNAGQVMNRVPNEITNGPIPFYYYAPVISRRGAAAPPSNAIANYQTNTAMIFGLVTRANGDLNLVGYYVARRVTTNLNGLVQANAHLFRYRRDPGETAAALSAYFGATNSIPTLFPEIDPTRDEILAHNVAGFSILALGQGVNSNGLNFSLPSVPDQGSRFHATLHLYPEEISQRLSAVEWTNTTNLIKFSRSYEFRVRPMARPVE